MAQSTARSGPRVVGDYLVGRQIGSGSFSVVSEARHRVHGTHVAIKEIAMSRLNKKLQESLMSEIFILRRIDHPNIIRLLDMIEVGSVGSFLKVGSFNAFIGLTLLFELIIMSLCKVTWEDTFGVGVLQRR